jgi:hypothetical protein
MLTAAAAADYQGPCQLAYLLRRLRELLIDFG